MRLAWVGRLPAAVSRASAALVRHQLCPLPHTPAPPLTHTHPPTHPPTHTHPNTHQPINQLLTHMCSLDDGFARYAPFEPAKPGAKAGEYQFTPGQASAVYPQIKGTRPLILDSVAEVGTPLAVGGGGGGGCSSGGGGSGGGGGAGVRVREWTKGYAPACSLISSAARSPSPPLHPKPASPPLPGRPAVQARPRAGPGK